MCQHRLVMVKRLFDLMVSLPLLVLSVPVLMLIAILIKLDSTGQACYRSQRVGRHGKRFGLFRFRTVDLQIAADLPMEARLTRVGRFIRNYSLDDLPNLLNIAKGDMSIVGPRPMEPELVDLHDPIWQEILTVRPGWFSYAILKLGKRYNAHSWEAKKGLELVYVRQQSLWFDLQVFWRTIQAHLTSRGNIKARGKSAV